MEAIWLRQQNKFLAHTTNQTGIDFIVKKAEIETFEKKWNCYRVPQSFQTIHQYCTEIETTLWFSYGIGIII